MARLPRPDFAGIPQHVVQRGNNRLPCFLDDEQEMYLTPFSYDVRQLIPQAIQEKVRAQCGDRDTATGRIVLPARCDIALPAEDVATGAAALRAQPHLAGGLRQHQATVATFLYNVDRLEFRLQKVSELNR